MERLKRGRKRLEKGLRRRQKSGWEIREIQNLSAQTSTLCLRLCSPIHFPPQSLNLKPQPIFDSEPLVGCSSLNKVDYEVDDLLILLRFAVLYGDVELARVVHASIFKLEEDTHLGNILIAAYLKLGLVGDAYSVLMGLSRPNVVSYTVLVSRFPKANQEGEAVELFFRMRKSSIKPNEYSFVAILSPCFEK